MSVHARLVEKLRCPRRRNRLHARDDSGDVSARGLVAARIQAGWIFFERVVLVEHRAKRRDQCGRGGRNQEGRDRRVVGVERCYERFEELVASRTCVGEQHLLFHRDVAKQAAAKLRVAGLVDVLWIRDRTCEQLVESRVVRGKVLINRSHGSSDQAGCAGTCDAYREIMIIWPAIVLAIVTSVLALGMSRGLRRYLTY